MLCGNCFGEEDEGARFCRHCGFELKADEPGVLPVGYVLHDRYLIGRVLGQGGFGITYKCLDRASGGVVAVKEYYPQTLCRRAEGSSEVMPTQAGTRDFAWGRGRFLQEAETLASLRNVSGIAHVHECFADNGTTYFSMDYVDGTDLKHYLVRYGGRVTWNRLRRIILPVMDALVSVHEQGLVHRDISPDNIIVSKSGAGVLLDFGSARLSLGDRTQTMTVVLKRNYSPVEQFFEHGKQGPYTDVYAMGATIYRCITGRIPLTSMQRFEAMATNRADPLPPMSRYASVSPDLEVVIAQAMSVEAKHRFQTMEAFRNALLQVRGSAPARQPGQGQGAARGGQARSGQATRPTGTSGGSGHAGAGTQSTGGSGGSGPGKTAGVGRRVVMGLVLAVVAFLVAYLIGLGMATVAQGAEAPGTEAASPAAIETVGVSTPAAGKTPIPRQEGGCGSGA